MRYRRAFICGGSYFFTVVTYKRRKLFVDEPTVSLLRDAFSRVMVKYPFTIDAMVVLPDHLHCVWTLPEDDANFAMRWRLVKTRVTQVLSDYGAQRLIRPADKVWQPRYWEHLLRDAADYRAHIDYIHYNPVRHGYVDKPIDWPYSSFRRYVEKGVLPKEWGSSEPGLPNEVGSE